MKTRKIFQLIVALLSNTVFVMAQSVPATLLPTTDNPLMSLTLDGTWRFRLLDGREMQTFGNAWIQGEYDDKDWNNIAVPGCWETQGFCKAEYGRRVIERNGLYRTRFVCPAEWKRQGRQIVLRIEAASMSYRCYVNGHDVGSYGRAHLPCNFDITPYVKAGDNTLCVNVSSHGPSWLYDVVDNWSFCGINRSVSVFCVEGSHISDITFRTDIVNGEANVELRTQMHLVGDKQGNKLVASLRNVSGQTVWKNTAAADTSGLYIIKGVVKRPRLWTAETPTLYDLQVELIAADGRMLHRRQQKVGLRDVRVEGRQLLVNGKPILLHGVCVSEAHPYLGAAYTKEEWRKQLIMMKQANVNFIRTAHYPMHPSLYDLADEMGLYICCEVPFASRGKEYLANSNRLEELYARADATVARDKNHPSVIMWSLGNENETTVGEVATHVKNLDPTRPRGFPQTIGPLSEMLKKPLPDVNLLMGHYFNPMQLKEMADKATVPFVQTEYGHSLGLAMGDFEDRWQRIVSTPGFVGGSVWCWQDGGAVTDSCKTDVCKGVWVDSLHYLDGYGHSVPKGAFERGKEAIDGIVYADGRPQEDYYLVRKMYSPVQLLADTLVAGKPLTIVNRNDFTSLDGYTLHWRQTDMNETLCEGDVKLHAQARQTEQVMLPTLDARRGTVVEFVVSNPKGEVIHERTLPIGESLDYARLLQELPRDRQMKIDIGHNGTLRITHKRLGILMNTKLCLRTGRKLTVTGLYRPGTKERWNPYIVEPEVLGFESSKKSTTIQCRWRKEKSDTEYIDGRVVLTELTNGTLDVSYTLTPSDSLKTSFTELGLALKADKQFDEFRWIGRGPYASTPDKYRHCEPGAWALASTDYRFDGNRRDVGICCLASVKNGQIYIVSDGGNVGVENLEGQVVVSDNVWVSGIGSKFTTPENMLHPQDIAKLKGHFVLKAFDLFKEAPTWICPIADIDEAENESPYMDSYGW